MTSFENHSMTAVPLLWINGFPGSGKLSVARELVKLSGNEMILIDNHQLIDPVEARIPRGHPDYQTERQLQRSITFHEFVAKTGVRSQIIFTDFQSNNELGRSVANEYKTAAQKGGRLFLPIYLSCDVAENLRRLASSERANHAKKKLLSKPVLQDIRSRCELYRFDTPEGFHIDVTHLLPDEAAREILAYINVRVQPNELEFGDGAAKR